MSERMNESMREYQFCHPRWPNERAYVDEKMNEYTSDNNTSTVDAWYVLEQSSVVGILAVLVSRAVVVCMRWYVCLIC